MLLIDELLLQIAALAKKCVIFIENIKNLLALRAPPPDPLGYGSWGLRPQTLDNPRVEKSWLRH